MRGGGLLALALSLAAPVIAAAAETTLGSGAEEATVSFIDCPIYRDTNNGRKSGCWLATNLVSGIRYDVSGGRSKPQIGREVLIEGRPSSGVNACGGALLLPVHVSVLATRCSSVMIPAEGFPGRAFHLSKNAYLPPADAVRPPPKGPFVSRDWQIEFNFQSDFLAYQYSEIILDEAARYIRASHPKRVEVIGYAASRPYVVSGRTLLEPRELAQARAQMVNEALLRLQVDPRVMRTSWHDDPMPTDADDGMAEPSKRRVTIRVQM